MTLRVGERLASIDLALVAGRAASISGVATDAAGRLLAGRTIGLGRELTGPDSGSYMVAGSAMVAGDGSFAIKNVPPGQYKLRVQAPRPGAGPNDPPEMVVMPISVDGVDLTNVALTTSPGGRLRVRSSRTPARRLG